MVGNIPGLTQIQTYKKNGNNTNREIIPEYTINVPLPFWFTKSFYLSTSCNSFK